MVVTDNGVPARSDSRTFQIVVAAPPQIIAVEASGPSVTVTWTSVPGIKYRLVYKAALDEPVWQSVDGDVTAGGATASKADNVSAASERFYRVQVVP